MQTLDLSILETARAEKMQKLEKQFQDVFIAHSSGELFICPFCNYSSRKNSKGSSKIFQNKFFKCFHCGIWRRI